MPRHSHDPTTLSNPKAAGGTASGGPVIHPFSKVIDLSSDDRLPLKITAAKADTAAPVAHWHGSAGNPIALDDDAGGNRAGSSVGLKCLGNRTANHNVVPSADLGACAITVQGTGSLLDKEIPRSTTHAAPPGDAIAGGLATSQRQHIRAAETASVSQKNSVSPLIGKKTAGRKKRIRAPRSAGAFARRMSTRRRKRVEGERLELGSIWL